eukprot:6083446-Pyramimonas_sp.AAC.3
MGGLILISTAKTEKIEKLRTRAYAQHLSPHKPFEALHDSPFLAKTDCPFLPLTQRECAATPTPVHLAIVYEVIMGVCYLVVRSYPCVLYTWCLAGHPPDSEQESAHFILVVYLVGARRITLLRRATLPTVNRSRNTLFSLYTWCAIAPAYRLATLSRVNWSNRHTIFSAIWLELQRIRSSKRFPLLWVHQGVFLFIVRWPERWMPGKFDIFFHSHNIFHVLVVVAACFHYKAAFTLLEWRDHQSCMVDEHMLHPFYTK